MGQGPGSRGVPTAGPRHGLASTVVCCPCYACCQPVHRVPGKDVEALVPGMHSGHVAGMVQAAVHGDLLPGQHLCSDTKRDGAQSAHSVQTYAEMAWPHLAPSQSLEEHGKTRQISGLH